MQNGQTGSDNVIQEEKKRSVPIYTLQALENLQVIRKFTGGGHAKAYLLERDVVKKVYEVNAKNKRYFEKEIKMMNHLEDCKFVAKLLGYNERTYTLYMTYCGKNPKRTPENLKKIKKAAQKLHKKWGVVRRELDGTIVYDIFVPNTGIIDGKIHFFDLAGDKWHIEPKSKSKSKPKPKPKSKPKSNNKK